MWDAKQSCRDVRIDLGALTFSPCENDLFTCFPGHWRSNFFGHSEIIGPKTCRPALLHITFYLKCCYLHTWSYRHMGLGWSSQGYRPERWLRQRCVLLLGDENRQNVLLVDSWWLVVTWWCFSGYGHCYSWFIPGHWMLIFLSVLLFVEVLWKHSKFLAFQCGNKANFGSLPTKTVNLNVEHFEHFSPGSGADPNLVGGTSRCAASVPCAQALAGQVGFPDKGTALSKANYE